MATPPPRIPIRQPVAPVSSVGSRSGRAEDDEPDAVVLPSAYLDDPLASAPRRDHPAGAARVVGEVAPWAPEALHRVPLWVAVSAAVLVAAGALVWAVALRPPPAPEDSIPFAAAGGSPSSPSSTTASAAAATTSAPGEVVVHAAGAVAVPGLYRLPAPARVDDVVRAAGGFAPDADVDRVNLAGEVVDGARVFVPRVGADVPAVVGDGGAAAGGGPGVDGGAASGGGAVRGNPAGPVDLNTASEAELDVLPGVGPATAAAIVDHRERNGPFRSVDQLLDVRGIGDAKLEALRDLVTVGGS